MSSNYRRLFCVLFSCKAIPIKCFVSHRPPSREGGSVGRTKKKRERSLEGVWVPGKAGLLSTKVWLRGPDGVTGTGLPNEKGYKNEVSMII